MGAGPLREPTSGPRCPNSHSRWSSLKSLRVVRELRQSFDPDGAYNDYRILQHRSSFCHIWHWGAVYQLVPPAARQQAILLGTWRRWSSPEKVSYKRQRSGCVDRAVGRGIRMSPGAYAAAGLMILGSYWGKHQGEECRWLIGERPPAPGFLQLEHVSEPSASLVQQESKGKSKYSMKLPLKVES